MKQAVYPDEGVVAPLDFCLLLLLFTHLLDVLVGVARCFALQLGSVGVGRCCRVVAGLTLAALLLSHCWCKYKRKYSKGIRAERPAGDGDGGRG